MRITVDGYKFSAAHFIPGQETCQYLHGHNFYVSVTLEGEINDDYFIASFRNVRSAIQTTIAPLYHVVLLPEEYANGDEPVTVGEYVLPRKGVTFLPINLSFNFWLE